MTRFVLAAVAVLTAATASAADYPFTVTVTGKGRPVVFVPGFGCSGKVWDSTVAHFKDRCECHVLTLAGFAGVPPVKGDGPFLDAVVKGVADYAKDKKLTNAAVVGHSLGAHVALRAAAAAPDQFTAAVLVDGFPAMMAVFDVKPEDAAKLAADRRERLSKATPEEFKTDMRAMFGSMLKGEKLGEAIKGVTTPGQPTGARGVGGLFAAAPRPGAGEGARPG